VDIAAMKAAMDKSHSSPLTAPIKVANDACDATFKEIKRMTKAAAQSTLVPKMAAGTLLMHFLEGFWDLDKNPLMTQIAMTRELLLRYDNDTSAQEAAQTIGIADLFEIERGQNLTLENLYRERLNEQSLTTPAATTLKGAVTEGYDTLCTLVIKNLNTDAPPEELIPVFHAMDEIRKKYSALSPAKFDLKDAVTEPIATQTYTGKAITPIPAAYYDNEELVFAKDFSVTYRNNVEVGEAVAVLHGKGKFTGFHERRFNIVKEL
jgi:hypothetical protein